MRYALRTFGSLGPKRRQFDTIDELEHGYGGRGQHDERLGAHLYGGDPRSTYEAQVESGQGITSISANGTVTDQRQRHKDGDEDCIIHTRTATVSYDYSPPE